MLTLTARHASPPLPPPAVRRRRFLNLQYGWPLTALFVGLGAWWAIGLGELAAIALAVPMAWQLRRARGGLRVPRGFLLWVTFIIWAVFALSMLGLHPPGTLPGSAVDRLLPAAYRIASFSAAAVILLYVGNLDPVRFSQRKLARVVGAGFIWVSLGGFLGILAPSFEFTSPVELLMPRGLRQNSFVMSFVHPIAAQVQDFLGYDAPRPAAPFGYTNAWGHAFALLLPWFIVGFVVYVKGWRRLAGITFAAVSIVPAVASMNRGLWAGLALLAIYAIVRQIMQGRLFVAVAAGLATSTIAAIIVISPLGQLIEQRLETGHSDNVRQYSIEKAVELGMQSPVLGLGSTRVAYGSASSIAVGATPSCPKCGNWPIGFNGQLWSEIVGRGFVGAGLYILTFALAAWRYRRDKTPVGIAAHGNLLIMFWFMLYYPALVVPLLIAFVGWGALWRNAEHSSLFGRGAIH